jgi:predicted AlkP superfamily phosphohydrolase/phosphomutase
MIKVRYTILLVLVLVTLFSCNDFEGEKNKVLVVHVRGVSYEQLILYLNKSESGFLKDAESNGHLNPLEPITNAVTISNIASFETGALPSAHGIIGHQYAKSDTSLQLVSGFSQPFEVPSFWELADLAGKRVLNVGALTLHGKYEQHSNVDTWAQGNIVASGSQIELKVNPYKYFSYQAVNGKTNLNFYAYNLESDSLIVDSDSIKENGYHGVLSPNDWIEISQMDEGTPGATRIKWVATNGDTIRLYQRATFKSRGYPESFIEKMDRTIGPSKGWPNIASYTSGQLTIETLLEEIDEEIEHVMEGFRAATSTKDYDLIVLDYPLMDRYGHLTYPSKKNPSISSLQLMSEAYDLMFTHLDDLKTFASTNGYNLIIASGHGFTDIDTAVNINSWLLEYGINSDVRSSDWNAIGVPGKVSAHIYLNPEIPVEDSGEILDLIQFMASNEEFVDEVYLSDELKEIGLDHKHAGDVFVLLKPGFVFSNNLSSGVAIVEKPVFQGDHGYSPKYATSKGFIYSNQKCYPCHVTQVAEMVLNKLGVTKY